MWHNHNGIEWWNSEGIDDGFVSRDSMTKVDSILWITSILTKYFSPTTNNKTKNQKLNLKHNKMK